MSAGGSAGGGTTREALAERVAAALRSGSFDPQHAGELFLRADAEASLRAFLGEVARIAVAGREAAGIRPVTLLGARYTPDLVVDEGSERVAVTITLLRGEGGSLTMALAGGLVLATAYPAVVAFVLDRRLPKRNPFDEPGQHDTAIGLSAGDRAVLGELQRRSGVRLELRRQDPFSW